MPYPERPHFDFPFRRANGKVAVVDQGSAQHLTAQEYAVVVTPLGARDARPEFGWPFPEFSNIPLDLAPLRAAIATFVPGSNAVVEEWADVANATIRHVRIQEQEQS